MINQEVNGFIFPNSIIDELLSELSHSELKCYLVVLRKTKGWNKEEDYISVSQFMKVTGLSNRSVIDACDSLVERGILERRTGERNTNIYSIKTYKPVTSEKSSLVKNFPSTSEKSSPVTSEKSSHTKNIIKKNITNNTLTGINAREKKSDAMALLEQFGITEQLADDFVKHRKTMKAPITERSMQFLAKQAEIAGIPITLAVEIILAKGTWKSFQADYAWQSTAVALGWRVPIPVTKKPQHNTGSEIDFDDMSIVGEPLRISEKTKHDLGL